MYLVAHGQAKTNRLPSKEVFTFCGGAKNRLAKRIDCVGRLPVPAVIHGGGWWEHLGEMPHVSLEGFQPYHKSVRLMLSSQYSICLHEPLGEKAGWVTARWYENLGCGLVNFTDIEYSESVLPRDHPLRVSSGEQLREKTLVRSYSEWIELQNELIDPAWLDWREWFSLPFREWIRQ